MQVQMKDTVNSGHVVNRRGNGPGTGGVIQIIDQIGKARFLDATISAMPKLPPA